LQKKNYMLIVDVGYAETKIIIKIIHGIAKPTVWP
jgi:hypothetical protein